MVSTRCCDARRAAPDRLIDVQRADQRRCRDAVPHATRPGDVLADRYRLVDLLSESGARAVLAGPRPDPRAARRAARDRRRRRARRAAARGRPPVGDRAGPAVPARARRRAQRGVLLRRQRVGLRHLARHHARDQRPAVAARGRLDRRRGGRLDRRRRTRGPSRTGAWCRRTCSSTTPAPSGSSGSASTPRCTGSRRASCAPTSATWRAAARVAHRHAGRATRPPQVPQAPRDHGRVLRPRQVRAGVPRPLDDLCDELLNPKGSRVRDVRDVASARGICVFLTDFVGDDAGLGAGDRAPQPRPQRDAWRCPFVPDILARPDDVEMPPVEGPDTDEPAATGGRRGPDGAGTPTTPRPARTSRTSDGAAHPGRPADLRRRERRRLLAGEASRPATAPATLRGAARSGRSSRPTTPHGDGPASQPAPPADGRRRPPRSEGRRVLAVPRPRLLERERHHPGVRRPGPERRRQRPGPPGAPARRPGRPGPAGRDRPRDRVQRQPGPDPAGRPAGGRPLLQRHPRRPALGQHRRRPGPGGGRGRGRLRPAGRPARGEPRRRGQRRRRRPRHVLVDLDLPPAARARRAQDRRRPGARPRRRAARSARSSSTWPARRPASRSSSPTRCPTGVDGLTAAGQEEPPGRASVALDGAATGRYLMLWLTALPATDDGRFRGEVVDVRVLATRDDRLDAGRPARGADRRRPAAGPRRRRPRRVRRPVPPAPRPAVGGRPAHHGQPRGRRRRAAGRDDRGVPAGRVVPRGRRRDHLAAPGRRQRLPRPAPGGEGAPGRPAARRPRGVRRPAGASRSPTGPRPTRRTSRWPTSAAGSCSPRSPSCPPSSAPPWCWWTWRATRSPTSPRCSTARSAP